ncbi:MAG: hypothetical protein IKZ54_07595 [Bacteroidales bacterium]|nr:hypothetical protein [Bacteroidales bacterium]
MSIHNPFEYEAANNLKQEDIIDYYIEDFNFSRFIQSTKNIFLIGERGSGKTMALLYNSFPIQYAIQKKAGIVSFEKIGIHIPCNTPLFMKKEYLLIPDDYKKAIICEHYLVLSILYSIANTLNEIEEIVNETNGIKENLFNELEYVWDIQLDRTSKTFYSAIMKFINREAITTQRKINAFDSDSFYENALSFSSSVLPFLQMMREINLLSKTHFLLMIDDAHDMNEYQIKALNSWIAYRDHSLFSFKVATVKVDRPTRITSTGGSILEGHDFITVDMEQAYQNEETDFYKLSKRIIEKRLERIGVSSTAEEFFPMNSSMQKDLERCREEARRIGMEKYGEEKTKSVSDFVYKYQRAIYFRNRSDKANKPPYSGFETIVDISTGVVRNLLDPCYWMYDSVMNTEKNNIEYISPLIQTNIIIDRSQRMWDTLQSGLDKVVNNCSSEDAKRILNLFKNLMVLFSHRLKMEISEPRAIVFSISQTDAYPDKYTSIISLLKIAQRAQYLYTRMGVGKDKGKQETYYVPNRLLFPFYGLDPHGQYARVSLKATVLYNAAFHNQSIPMDSFNDKNNPNQLILDYGE